MRSCAAEKDTESRRRQARHQTIDKDAEAVSMKLSTFIMASVPTMITMMMMMMIGCHRDASAAAVTPDSSTADNFTSSTSLWPPLEAVVNATNATRSRSVARHLSILSHARSTDVTSW